MISVKSGPLEIRRFPRATGFGLLGRKLYLTLGLWDSRVGLELRVAQRVVVKSQRCDRDSIEEGGVVAACGVETEELDGVDPGGHGERGGGVGLVRRTGGLEGAHYLAVDQHLEVLDGGARLPRWAASKEIV